MKRKGCCFGCLAVAVLALVALCALVYWGLYELDILGEVPRSDTTAPIDGEPAFCVFLNPNQPSLVTLLAEGVGTSPGLVESFLFHETRFAIVSDLETGENSLILAASLRRLGGFIELVLGDPEEWRWWPGQRMGSAKLEQPGLWVVRSELTVDEDLRRNVAQSWQERVTEPLRVSGDHALEVLLDNRDGRGMLALEPLLVEREGQRDEIAVMKPLFDIEHAGRLPGLFRRVRTLRLTADAPEDDVLHIVVDADCRDAAAAESLLFMLLLVRDTAYRSLIEEDIILEGAFECTAAVIQGAFTVSGYRKAAIQQLQNMLQ